MAIRSVGLITYHHPHLKTEQVLLRLLPQGLALRIYALPFTPRPQRPVLFAHRPDMEAAVAPEMLAKRHGIPYVQCASDTDIDDACELYLVLGAGILSAQCIAAKRIINGHPGIIPAMRGLDSFKWAILERQPLGVSLHYIDAEVDAGEIIAVLPTPVYTGDTLQTLARRHYENEIDCLARFAEFLEKPYNPFKDIAVGEPKRRMPQAVEQGLAAALVDYVGTFAG